jgi:hypothetical protein
MGLFFEMLGSAIGVDVWEVALGLDASLGRDVVRSWSGDLAQIISCIVFII